MMRTPRSIVRTDLHGCAAPVPIAAQRMGRDRATGHYPRPPRRRHGRRRDGPRRARGPGIGARFVARTPRRGDLSGGEPAAPARAARPVVRAAGDPSARASPGRGPHGKCPLQDRDVLARHPRPRSDHPAEREPRRPTGRSGANPVACLGKTIADPPRTIGVRSAPSRSRGPSPRTARRARRPSSGHRAEAPTPIVAGTRCSDRLAD